MNTLRGFRRWLVAAAIPLTMLFPSAAQGQSLYSQSVTTLLQQQFPSPRIEFQLWKLDDLAASHPQPIAQRWNDPEQPIPVGSLLKPFLALAWADLHAGAGAGQPQSIVPFPTVRCNGKSDGCWRPNGHGDVQLIRALAQSCNVYFLALARDLASSRAQSLQHVAAIYGLPAPPVPKADPNTLARIWVGLTPEWRVPPRSLVRAYAALIATPSPTQHLLLSGMSQAALPQGTAAKIGTHPGSVLAKTGTAPCVPDSSRDSRSGSQPCLASADGLVVVLHPADHPQWLLLVRKRGTTGAETAAVAGRMLSSLEAVHGSPR